MSQVDKFIKAFQLKYPTLSTVLVYSNPDTDEVWVEDWPLEEPAPTWEDLEPTWAEWEAGELGRRKTGAIAEVNRLAGEARSRVGTNIPFQGDVYQLKGEEAFAFASDPEPNQYKYPLLYAEAQARGMELPALVSEYAYNAVMWPRILAAIEAVRMGARVAIEAATTVAEVESALVGVVWPV